MIILIIIRPGFTPERAVQRIAEMRLSACARNSANVGSDKDAYLISACCRSEKRFATALTAKHFFVHADQQPQGFQYGVREALDRGLGTSRQGRRRRGWPWRGTARAHRADSLWQRRRSSSRKPPTFMPPTRVARNGKRQPSLSSLFALASGLGVSAETLVGRTRLARRSGTQARAKWSAIGSRRR